MTLQELIVRVSADVSGMSQGFQDALRDAGGFGAGIDRIQSKLDGIGAVAAKAGGVLSATVSLPLAGLGALAVKSAADMDSLFRGLVSVTGSAEAAGAEFERLKEVAKLPGLGFRDAVEGAINLQAAGMSAGLAERALKSFGNALATVGKGKAELDGVITALTQISAKGKVSAEEINQLAERLPQIRKAMKDAFGTADTEVLQKMGIDSETFIKKIIEQFEKLPKVAGGLKNDLENMTDAWDQALAKLGKALAPAVTSATANMEPLAGAVGALAEGFAKLPGPIQATAIALGAVAVAAGPVALSISGIAKTVSLAAGALGTAGLAGALGNIIFALQGGLTGALTLGESLLLRFGQAALVAAAGFAGWKVGEIMYENVPAIQSFGDAIAELILQIPGVEKLMNVLSGAAAAQEHADKDLEATTLKLEEALKKKGITIERAGMSAADYAAKLRDAARDAGLFAQQATNTGTATNQYQQGLQKLVTEHAKLTEEVNRTRGVLEEARKQKAAGAIGADVLRAAEENYAKAVQAATGAEKTHILSVGELVQKQSFLNAEVARAEAVFAEMQRRYDAGTASAVELARAHDQLNAAIKAARGNASDWLSVYNQIIEQQTVAKEEAQAAALAYLQMLQDYKAGSAEIARAHDLMVSKLQAAKLNWSDIIQEVGGYTVEVVKAGQVVKQAVDPMGEALRVFSDGINQVAVDTAKFTQAAVPGLEKVRFTIDGIAQTVEIYRGHVSQAANEWRDTAAAASTASPPAREVADEAERIAPSLYRASLEAYGLADGLFEAARAGFSLYDSVKRFLDLNVGTASQGAPITSHIGTFELFDPRNPEAGGWVPGRPGGSLSPGMSMTFIPPQNSSAWQGVEARGAPAESEEPWRRRTGESPAAAPAPAAPATAFNAEQERLNEQLVQMIAANLPLEEILKFAGRIGAYVTKSVTDQGTLIVQFTRANGTLDNFLTRLPYLGDELARAVQGAGEEMAKSLGSVGITVADAVSSAAQQMGVTLLDMGEQAASSVQAAADTMREIVHPSLGGFDLAPVGVPAIPAAASGAGQWIRGLTAAEMAAMRPNIEISNNVFRSREDEDYLISRAKSLF